MRHALRFKKCGKNMYSAIYLYMIVSPLFKYIYIATMCQNFIIMQSQKLHSALLLVYHWNLIKRNKREANIEFVAICV